MSAARTRPAIAAVVGALGVAVVVAAVDGDGKTVTSVPAADGVTAAAHTNRVVLVGEIHRWSAEHRVLRRLLADSAIRGGVTDVVVEFGNARYQRLVDRYVAGASVSITVVSRAWRETTQGGVWSTADYAAFFRAVRAHNAKHPAARLRLVLGDPPFRPGKTPPSQHDYWILQRDIHFAHVIHREVISRGRRALVIAGVGHVVRRADAVPTLTNLLEGTAECATDPQSITVGIDWCDDLRQDAPVADTYVIVPTPAAGAAATTINAPAGHLAEVTDERSERALAEALADAVNGDASGPPGRRAADALLIVGH